MLITSKFDGRCGKCGKPIPQGTQIEYSDRKAYHLECSEPASLLPDAEQQSLADKLGFKHYEWDTLIERMNPCP